MKTGELVLGVGIVGLIGYLVWKNLGQGAISLTSPHNLFTDLAYLNACPSGQLPYYGPDGSMAGCSPVVVKDPITGQARLWRDTSSPCSGWQMINPFCNPHYQGP